VAQHAALAALGPVTRMLLEQRKAELQRRRDDLIPELQRLGFGVPVLPQGAFYVYADISQFSGDGQGFAADLLEQAGVAITPGADFGRHLATRHVRFAYTTGEARLREAVFRMGQFLDNRQ
jgi:aspartate/methionine/tyrosine aminotransferase